RLAIERNVELEYERNLERYAFMRWGQGAFDNFKVVPPNTGIVHQVNLEYLARVVDVRDGVAFPDTVIGTDSHTTMVNGLGVLGVDDVTLGYLRLTGRDAARIALVEAYCKENLLWHEPDEHPEYSQVVELDLGDVEPSLAGPRRPQDRVPLARAKEMFLDSL